MEIIETSHDYNFALGLPIHTIFGDLDLCFKGTGVSES